MQYVAIAPLGVLVVDDDVGWTDVVAETLVRGDVSVGRRRRTPRAALC